MTDVYSKLTALNIELPESPPMGGIYTAVKQVGKLLFVSGRGTTIQGVTITGKVGSDRTVLEGQDAAKRCAINALATLHEYLGDLNQVKGVVKILGFVASAPGFNDQAQVINGCSQLFKDLWDVEGLAARSAIGVNELPKNYTVEIEFIFELI